jgi:uncharacterized membrane protein YfcA
VEAEPAVTFPEPDLAVYYGVVLFVAYAVRGIAGFGSGLIAVPLLTLASPMTAVVPLVVSLDYLGSASQGIKNVGQIAWRDQLVLVPYMLTGVGVGLALLRSAPTATLTRTLGAFLVLYALYQWLPAPPLRSSRMAAAGCGVMGGLAGTLFGTGGPFYVIYFNLRALEKSVFRATFAVNFLLDGGIRLIAYALTGLYRWETLAVLVAALPVAGAGLYLGGRVHTGLTQRFFVQFISLLLFASGLALLLKA